MLKKTSYILNIIFFILLITIGFKHYKKIDSDFYPNNLNNEIYRSNKLVNIQKPKAIYVGIDGLDLDIIGKHIDSLPNFKKLINSSAFGYSYPYNSSFCSPENFISILTGKTSNNHGITSFFSKENELLMSRKNLRSKTICDILSNKKKKSYSINHFASWPVVNKKVNTISQLFIVKKGLEQIFGKVSVFNELFNNFYGDFKFKNTINLISDINIDKQFFDFKYYLKVMKNFKIKTDYSILQKKYQKNLINAKVSTDTYFDYIGLNEKEIDRLPITNKEMIKKRVNFYKKLTNSNFIYMIPMQVLSFIVDQISWDISFEILKQKNFDFLTLYISSFDEFMHTFHQYEENEIKNYLVYLDSQIGKLINKIDDNTLLIISSDHGFNSIWQKMLNKKNQSEFKFTSDHTYRGSVFIYSKKHVKNLFINRSSILDITPTLLYYFGLNTSNFQGKPLKAIFK